MLSEVQWRCAVLMCSAERVPSHSGIVRNWSRWIRVERTLPLAHLVCYMRMTAVPMMTACQTLPTVGKTHQRRPSHLRPVCGTILRCQVHVSVHCALIANPPLPLLVDPHEYVPFLITPTTCRTRKILLHRRGIVPAGKYSIPPCPAEPKKHSIFDPPVLYRGYPRGSTLANLER